MNRRLSLAAIALALCGAQCALDGRYRIAGASLTLAAGTAVAARRTGGRRHG